MEQYETISKYDRTYGAMRDVCLRIPKASTIQDVDLLGRSQTFVVETMRHAEHGDYIFVQCIDESQTVTRLALPPKVANAIAAQRDSLTARRRRISAKATMKARMDAGFVPDFKRKRKSKA